MHEEKFFRKLQILEKSLACNKERVLQSPGLRGNIQQPAIHTIAMCGPDQILREENGVGNEKVSRQMKKFHLKKEGNTVWPKLTKIYAMCIMHKLRAMRMHRHKSLSVSIFLPGLELKF